MKISVCPDCYKKGELIKGKILNECYVNGEVYVMYWCENCKESYRED